MQKVETNRSVSTFFWLDSTQDGNQPDKGGNQPGGFHLDNIDGPYGMYGVPSFDTRSMLLYKFLQIMMFWGLLEI